MANVAVSSVVTLVFFSVIPSLNAAGLFGGPLHASCKVDWTFKTDCATVGNKLVEQIEKWKGEDNCKNGGEKCLYALTQKSSTEITGTHETPVKHYKDDISFGLKTCQGNGCCVHGYSTSETWYAHLDFSTNYCNLRNLIDGAGLDKDAGFKEDTNDGECTQYSSKNCEKY